MDIVGKQQRGKYYASLKAGKYSRLCKTPTALQGEKEKQAERLHSLGTLVDRMVGEYPELQTSFRDLSVAIMSHEGGDEAVLDRSMASSTSSRASTSLSDHKQREQVRSVDIV